MFGPYQVTEELYLTSTGAVLRAKRLDDETGNYVVKRFSVPADDPSEPHWDHAIFLDRARVQQQVVAGGARHWAVVYQVGVSDSGAWFATDYLPLSAQKLLDAKVEVGAAALHSVANSIVEGLIELRSARGRPHGNLKPSNVLFDGKDLTTARVLLTDLGSPAQAAKAGEPGDVQALGQLIYQLVMHEPFSDQPWPLQDDPRWQALGADADVWRQLCGDLLVPVAALRPPLEIVASRLEPLAPRRPTHKLRGALIAALVPLAILMAGVVTLTVLDHSARNKFAQSRQQWFGAFAIAMQNPARRHVYLSDPTLRQITEAMSPRRIDLLPTSSSGLLCWSVSDYRQAVAANALVQQVQTDLTPDHWACLADAMSMKAKFESRAWPQPADYLGKLIDAARPGPGADVAPAIDRLLELTPRIAQELAKADDSWKQLSEKTQEIQKKDDRTLKAMAVFLRSSAAAGIEITSSGLHGFDQVRQNARLAERLATATRDFPSNVDRQRLTKDVSDSMDLDRLQRGDIEQYLGLLALNSIRRDETGAAVVALQKRLGDTVELVDKSHPDQREQTELKKGHENALASIADFGKSVFTARSMADGTFAARRTEVEAKIDSLRRFYHADGPEDWLKTLPVLSTSSPRINAYWEAWRQLLHESIDEMTRDRDLFADYKQRADRLRNLLTNLDSQFPPVPRGLNANYTAAAANRREAFLEKLLPLIDPRSARLDPNAQKTAQAQYGQWSDNLKALAVDFPIRKQVLLLSDRPDKKWESKSAFWRDPVIQSLVKVDLDRINRLQSLTRLRRNDLANKAKQSNDPEVMLAAWQLLGTHQTPPWPAEPGELTTELSLRQGIEQAIKELPGREATAIAADLKTQGPVRWKRFVEAAGSESMLAEAIAGQRGSAITTEDVASLSAPARFNLWTYVLKQGIDRQNDQIVQDAVANLRTAANDLKDQDLVEHLARLNDREAFADQNPGEVFTTGILGVQPAVEFRRVQPHDSRPFYLATTEVSFGQFSAVVQAANAWGEAKKLPWAYSSTQRDPRRGPRVWEWAGQSTIPMSCPQYWLTPDEDNDFAMPFRAGRFNRMVLADRYGGPPEPDHPMQQISAQVALYYAALCGCRLPSTSEWLAAYEQFEKATTDAQWNLRDQTWEQQRKYLADSGSTRSLEDGIFRTEPASGGQRAKAMSFDDGTLYFRHVASPASGSVFHHLIGNVAEYECDDVEAFDSWKDKKTAAGIAGFAKSEAHSLFVIGGSALGPTDVAPTRPLPVTHTDQGYADVGLRLAFTAPARSLAERVKWTVGPLKYRWPAVAQGNN